MSPRTAHSPALSCSRLLGMRPTLTLAEAAPGRLSGSHEWTSLPGMFVPYTPLAHPSTPGRWDRATILAALQAWVREAGGVPRRQDWSGQRAEPVAAAQRKWMGEHPRWPSSSCVARHFGTWSAALEAAALPARAQRFEDTVAERVAAARRLAGAGVPVAAIAAALSVSASSVHNYLRAAPCPGCGGPVTNPNAARCAACTAHEATVARTWTRDAVRQPCAPGRPNTTTCPPTTSGRRRARGRAAGRPRARAGRAPPSSARCTAPGTPRCRTRAPARARGAGPTTPCAPPWPPSGPAPAARRPRPTWPRPRGTARTPAPCAAVMAACSVAWDAVGPVPAEPVAPALEALSR